MMFKVVIGTCLLVGCALADHAPAPAPGEIEIDAVEELKEVENDYLLVEEKRTAFDAEDWVTFAEMPEDPPPSYVVSENVGSKPFLATLPGDGMAFTFFQFEPCSISQPHIHPRATEWYLTLEGSFEVGVVQENGPGAGETVLNNVTQYQGHLVPMGLLHWHYNNSCEPAKMVAVLDNRDPGILFMAERFLFNVPDGVLRAALGLDDSKLNIVKGQISGVFDNFPFNIDPVCAERCGL